MRQTNERPASAANTAGPKPNRRSDGRDTPIIGEAEAAVKATGQIAVSYFATYNSTKPEAARHSWPEFVTILSSHARLPRKEAGRLFSPVEYEAGHTRKDGDHPAVVTLAVSDLDHDVNVVTLRQYLEQHGLAFVIYSSYNHKPDAPRVRVVVPLAAPVTRDQWPEVVKRWLTFLAESGCKPDTGCIDAKRMYYLPAAPKGAEVVALSGDGAALTLDMLPVMMIAPAPPEWRGGNGAADSDRPGDDFNQRGEILPVLEQHGWFIHPELVDTESKLTRPGKNPGEGISATFGHKGRRIFHVFTSSAPPFEANRGYAPFTVYALLEHGGDFAAAASDLRRQGFGSGDSDQRTNQLDKGTTPDNGAGQPEEDNSMDALAIVEGGQTDEIRMTDLGNARRLVARHGHDLRFDHQRGLWLIWDGRRWAPDDTSEITRRAKDTVAAMYKEAATLRSDSDRQTLVKHALKSEGRTPITSMIDLAKSEPGVPVLAADTDSDPWLFNCANGTIDLRTGELLEHRREDLITRMAPVKYDPGATHPLWDDLLQRVTGGDTDTMAYLQKAAGYTLTGSTREDKAFCLVSEGGGGKTSFLEPIVKTMGDYATIAEDTTFVAHHSGASGHSEDVAALAGARLVISTEMGRGKLAEERFKRMTGGDSIRASRKHERSFQFTPQFKLWMAMNRALRADDEDTGVWRRLRYIPWLPIPEDERDPQVKETLLRDPAARAAVLAWMVAGCRAYLADGLGDPPAVIAATEHRREENNPMAAFFDDCCVFAPDAWTPARALREAYEDWCKDSGARPVNLGDWGRRLHERGAKNGRDYVRGRHWEGVGLLIFERGMSVMSVHDSPSPHSFHDSSHVGENGRTTDMHRHDCHEDGVSDGSDDGVEIVEEVL